MNHPLKADATAAERLLRAAVREAINRLRDGEPVVDVTAMLEESGRSAELVLGGVR